MDNKEIKNLIDEIKVIRDMVLKDKEVVDKFILSRGIRYLSLVFGGIVLIMFWGIYELVRLGYDTSVFSRYFIVGVLVLISIVAGVVKFLSWRSIDPSFSLTSFVSKVLGVGYIKVFFVLVGIMVFLSLYLVMVGLYGYLLVVIGVGVGILYLLYGVMFHNFELEFLSYYIILTSLLSLFFVSKDSYDVYLWVGIVFGVGFILFFLMTTIRVMRER